MRQNQKEAVHIKEVGREDVPALISLIRELAEYENLLQDVKVTEEVMASSLFGERRVAEARLIFKDGDLAGYCIFFRNFSTFLGKPGIYVEDIYIRPSFRCNGIGRAVFIHLARLALEQDCARLEFAVLDWNEPAISFYRGLGAEKLDAWDLYRFTGKNLEALACLDR